MKLTFLYYGASRSAEQLGTLMKEDFAKAGVTLELASVDFAVQLDRLRHHAFDASALQWTLSLEQDNYDLFHSSQAAGGQNFGSYKSPAADALLDEIRRTADDATRHALDRQLHRRGPRRAAVHLHLDARGRDACCRRGCTRWRRRRMVSRSRGPGCHLERCLHLAKSAPMRTLARRLVMVPLTLVGITLVTFVLLHALPGDAALVQAGSSRGGSPESLAAMRHQYGLDRSLPAQYAAWLARSARLDFGDSLVDGRPVRAKIAAALPTTLALALLAAALAFGVAVPLGAALAWCDRCRWARASAAALYALYALPVAAVALLALRAGAPWGARTLAGMLPAAACLALAETVKLARYQRGAVLDALAADYVITARAKGARRARGHRARAAPTRSCRW